MKNFDEARRIRTKRSVEDRSFVLGGEQFVVRARVRPDLLTAFDRIKDQKTDPTTCRCDHRAHPGVPCLDETCECESFSPKVLEAGSPLSETLGALDEVMLALLDPTDDSHARWRTVRDNEVDVVDVDDLRDVIEWAIEVATTRPTLPPSDSPDGRTTTGTASTADSSSPAIPAA